MKEIVWGGTHRGYRRNSEDRNYYFVDDRLTYDVVRVADRRNNRKMIQWIRELGYDPIYLDRYVDRMFMSSGVGKSRKYLEQTVKNAAEKWRIGREQQKEKEEEWKNLRERFGGMVIGLDKEFSVYESGFSVRVLMSARRGFEERKKFVQENQKEFWVYVIEEVGKSKRIMNKIGDIRFYEPEELILMRVPEIEVKFKIKGEVM